MSDEADIGAEITLSYSSNGGTSYTELAEVRDFKPGEMTLADVKKSHYKTPNQRHSHKAGWIDEGQATFQLAFTVEKYMELRAIAASRAEKRWKIEIHGQDPIIFDGYVNKVGAALPSEEIMTCDCGIKVNSEVTVDEEA